MRDGIDPTMYSASMQRRLDHEALERALQPDWSCNLTITPGPYFTDKRKASGNNWHGNRDVELWAQDSEAWIIAPACCVCPGCIASKMLYAEAKRRKEI